MKRKELRAAIEGWLQRGDLRPTTFADAYRVRPATVVSEVEAMLTEQVVRVTGEYQVFGARGISTYRIYAPLAEAMKGGERLAA